MVDFGETAGPPRLNVELLDEEVGKLRDKERELWIECGSVGCGRADDLPLKFAEEKLGFTADATAKRRI